MPGGNITLEKTLPNSVESERAVLGAIILDHKAIFPATVFDKIRREREEVQHGSDCVV